MRSDGDWSHSVLLEGEWTAVETGALSGLRTGADQSNHLHLIVIGDEGLFFINGQMVAILDMSDLMDAGDVAAVTGTFSGREIEGQATQVEDFTVWSLDLPVFGPSSGYLPHEPEDGKIETDDADVLLTDLVAEAIFKNPYPLSVGGWDYGFLFRNPIATEGQLIRVSSGEAWNHNVLTDGEWSTYDSGTLIDFRNEAGQSNLLRIVAIGDDGMFFVNGEFITALDLSGLTNAGDISAVTGSFAGNEFEGESTQFEGFTVWSLD